jgi:DNA integrity scanning protein DisA with diadenylate cyclase activity
MKSQKNKEKEIEELLIRTGIDVAKKGEGALFVISDNCEYKPLLKQRIQPFSLYEEGALKLLTSIATVDGAVIINKNGVITDYGAMIKQKHVFQGYGTRHAAGYSASLLKDTTSIVVSQEERKVKVFKQGKLIMQVDALEKNIEKKFDEATHIFESIGFGTFSSLGVAVLAPGLLGVTVVPGIILFGLPYYILKKLQNNKND